MTCPRCQQDNPTHARFCLACGARLALACGACGAELPGGARFCLQCGQAVAGSAAAPVRSPTPETYTPRHLAEKILTSKAALEGERKQVTVLFADLKGSMELLADRDPEEARKLLDPVLERMMEAVHHYEGTVNQVMGDGIMALFGAPLAHEDHAVRACYAALRMQESIGRYAEGVRRVEGIPLQIRVGLNSGEVVVRAIGSDLHMDYTAIGQTTHLAARMEQMALAGSILMTAETFRLAEGFIQVKPLGPLPVKGLSGPIDVYEVVDVEPVRSRLHATAARGLTRFVGRDPEIEQLRVALERAKSGHGQVVAVVGEAGVGKSRLYWEFVHSHRTEGCLVVESRSVSYGKATSYLPVIDLLKAYFVIEARDEPRRLREKVTGRLLSLDEALRPTLPALLALLDLAIDEPAWQALDPAQRRQKTLDAMKRLLLRESEEQPLVLVFEDLHWIDSQTQAVLDALVDGLPTARILLLLNYRPEYQHDWGSKGVYHQIRIDPLPVASADDLLTDLLGADPVTAGLKRRLIDRTHGNPFFLEESVRALLETGALVGERGAHRLVRPLEEARVPATVQAVLAARIDRLPPEDKRLLQSAAVIGKDIPGPLLEAIAELSEPDLRRSLASLQAAEFLYETRLYPEHEYTFKHALTHEVAYEGVLHERRRALHARIAETIEHLHRDRFAEQVDRLAHHALRGEAWDKAVRYLRTAAIRAMERSAYREATLRLEEALGALAHLPDTRERDAEEIDARIDLVLALQAIADLGHLIDHLSVARSRAESIGDRRRLGLVLAYMARALFVLGEHERAIEVGREALAIETSDEDPEAQVMARFALGVAYHALGEYEQATLLLRENSTVLAGAVPERFGLERFGLHYRAYLTVGSHTWLVYCLAEQGEFAEAIARAGDGMAIAERVGHSYGRLVALDGLAFAHLLRGDHGLAIPLLERGLALCRESQILLWDPDFVCGLGYGYALRGGAADLLPQMERSIQAQESLGQKNTLAFWMTWLCEAYLSMGRHDDTRQTVSRALTLARERHQRGVQALCHRLEAEVTMQVEPFDLDRADRQYREALLLATELGMRPLVAHCHLGLGTLYRRTGKREDAKELLTTATTMYREMGMTFWLEKADAESRGVER